MTHSRRDFLKALGVTAGGLLAVHLTEGTFSLIQPIEAAQPGADEFKALAEAAFNQARELGCSYADILINGYRTGSVRTSSGVSDELSRGELNHVSTMIETASFRAQVRVLHSGVWGFAASPGVTKRDMAVLVAQAIDIAQANAGIAHRPVLLPRAAVFKDPSILLHQEDHLDALINEQMADLQWVEKTITFRTEETYFATTEGSYSHTTRISRL